MATTDPRPLTGPTCPHCGTSFRRRRYWTQFDTAMCPGCGCRAEKFGRHDEGSFIFGGPRKDYIVEGKGAP